jgi:hypothetical protein
MLNVAIILVLTLLSGISDSHGFIHASRMWRDGTLDSRELLQSAVWFSVGIVLFWFSVKYMNQVWDLSAEVKTLLWFVATIVGVAAVNGTFFQWKPADQVVGLGVLSGVAWLLWRTGG